MMMNGLRHWGTEVLVLVACCIALSAFEAKAAPVDPENSAVTLLSNCGYLSLADSRNISVEKMSEAVTKFQTRMGIDVTGILDTETFRLLSLPGCGNTDIVPSRPKRNPLPDPRVRLADGTSSYNICGLLGTCLNR